mgnify:CR=1 FL=1
MRPFHATDDPHGSEGEGEVQAEGRDLGVNGAHDRVTFEHVVIHFCAQNNAFGQAIIDTAANEVAAFIDIGIVRFEMGIAHSAVNQRVTQIVAAFDTGADQRYVIVGRASETRLCCIGTASGSRARD